MIFRGAEPGLNLGRRDAEDPLDRVNDRRLVVELVDDCSAP